MQKLEKLSLERLPPHDLEAEQAILCAMLLRDDAARIARKSLRPEDFYRGSHAKIFTCLTDVFFLDRSNGLCQGVHVRVA